jgi:DNA invertase Pin-like site-specific DNA recombinase
VLATALDLGANRRTMDVTAAQRAATMALAAALDGMLSGDTLVVWRLDRFARSMKQPIETVEDLEGREVGFRSLTESIDTNTSGGKLVFHIFGALAAFERCIIQARTRAGLAVARARGRTGRRPLSRDGKDKAAGLALLRNPGIPVKEVARRLGISVATLDHHFPDGRPSVIARQTLQF